jgi:ABC-2 type transport system permease protein
MNTQSNAMPESSRDLRSNDSQGIAPTAMTVTHPFYWSVRREVWEYRSLYLVPLAAAAVALFGFLIATLGRALTLPNPVDRLAVLEGPFDFTMGLILGTGFIVGIFYCLDSLYGERRDRSILFWKSLPVSDLTTVLSKVTVGVVLLPLFGFAVTVVTQLIMLAVGSAVVRASGLDVATFWNNLSLFHSSVGLLNHLVTVHILWYAPLYGWLFLVSAWARRAPFLWAVVPPFAIGILEKISFNTLHFATFLQDRFTGSHGAAPMTGSAPVDPMTHIPSGILLISPGMWIGLAITAAFLAGAVRLRRYRDPI